ncbi:MAG: hypothetical protein R2849_16115 [Thermomicrobiales bacterium]
MLIYAVVVGLELVLSLVMLLVLLLTIAPRGRSDEPVPAPVGTREINVRFPDDLDRSLRLAFVELSRGSRDVALMVHTRTLLQRDQRQGAVDERD